MNTFSAKGRILVVDDDPSVRRLLELALTTAGYAVRAAAGSEQARSKLAAQLPDLVITELRRDGVDGIELLHHIRSRGFTVPVIILAARCTVSEVVGAIRAGAFSVLQKSCDRHTLLEEIASAMALSGRKPGAEEPDQGWRAGLLTRSPRMDVLLQRAQYAARTRAPVLVQGESGSGKKALAHAIHRLSARANGPFVILNCAAISAERLEHEMAWLQGAEAPGNNSVIRSAHGGTLVLDDTGAMPMRLQAELLRMLENRWMRPQHAFRAPPDVRIISTARDGLERALAEGEFRRDLYYCLQAVALDVPPLRERVEDIALLAGHFLDSMAGGGNGCARTFSPEAIRLLQQASWPGNVRQLRNVVEQMHALCSGPVISADLVARALRGDFHSFVPLTEACDEFKRDYLSMLLRAVHANVTEAARIAGRSRTQFYRLLQRHQLDQRDFR